MEKGTAASPIRDPPPALEKALPSVALTLTPLPRSVGRPGKSPALPFPCSSVKHEASQKERSSGDPVEGIPPGGF